jgi:hypothetical protein
MSAWSRTQFYGAASVKIDAVNYYPTGDTQVALVAARRRTGHANPAAWRAARIRANMPGRLHLILPLALAYIAMNPRDPALADIRGGGRSIWSMTAKRWPAK